MGAALQQHKSGPAIEFSATLNLLAGDLTYRLRLEREELIVCLVHRGKVVHGGNIDVDLEHIFLAAAGCLKDGLEVLQGLPLR